MADELEVQEQGAPARRSGGAFGTFMLAFIMLAVLVTACVVGGYFFYMGGKEAPKFTVTGFDLDEVKPAQTEYSYTPPPKPNAVSPAPIAGLENMREESASAPPPAAGAPPVVSAAQAAKNLARDKREQEWLARNGGVLRATQARLAQITAKYYQQYPVVRSVDQAFGRMPRYMAIKGRYEKDGNPYAFVRDSIGLPEVRNEIARRLADPQAWKATMGMINEAMKVTPPKSVYDEAKRFMKSDEVVTAYVLHQFQPAVEKHRDKATAAIDPTINLAGLTRLMQDVTPSAADLKASAQPSTR